MKKLSILLLMLPFLTLSQNQKVIALDPFSSISIHPYFEVELKEGNEESIEIVSSDVSHNKINIDYSGKTLHVYLDDAKVSFRKMFDSDDFDRYRGRKVVAIITYKKLDMLTVYGEEKITMEDPIEQSNFRLKVYGEVDLRIASLLTSKLKVSMYGDNKLKIADGEVPTQSYSLYGDNEIHAKNLEGGELKLSNFGDNKLYVGWQDYLKVTAFGDVLISCLGNPELDRRITIGEMTVVSR